MVILVASGKVVLVSTLCYLLCLSINAHEKATLNILWFMVILVASGKFRVHVLLVQHLCHRSLYTTVLTKCFAAFEHIIYNHRLDYTGEEIAL